MRPSWVFATLGAACALALGGCSKEIDSAQAPAGAGASSTAVASPSEQQLARPGVGLDGGLADGATNPAATMGASPAAEGSTNTTTKSSVGNR